jgi:hypothetical protein
LSKRVAPHVGSNNTNNQDVVPDTAPSSATGTNLGSTTQQHNPFRTISDVVTPPILNDKFDNELAGAAGGMIGKIVVYKSGKTVLQFHGQDGEKVSESYKIA